MRLALPASIPASCFFDQEAVSNKDSKGDIRGFSKWDWKISKWVALLAQQSSWYFPKSASLYTMSEKEKNPGGCHTKKTKWHFSTLIFQAKVWIVSVRTIVGVTKIASQKNVEPWSLCKEAKWPCKQEVGSFDEELWQMTPIPAAFICSKACDIIAEDTFSVASQHSRVLFLRLGGSTYENSKGDIRGFPNWDWKISKQLLSSSEHCKNTTHHTKWLCLLQYFSNFLHFLS